MGYSNNYITIKIHNQNYKALIDTGSANSIISKKTVQRLGLNTRPLPPVDFIVLFSASGDALQVTALADFELSVAGLIIPHSAKIVSNIIHPIILGIDFLQANEVVLDYKRGVATIYDNLLQVPLINYNQKGICAITTEPVRIPSFTEAFITVSVSRQFDNQIVLLEPISSFQLRSFALARSFSVCKNGKLTCKILNFNPQTMVLRKGTKVGILEPITNLSTCSIYQDSNQNEVDENIEQTSPVILEEFLQEQNFKIAPELSDQQRYELLNLLFKYKAVFAKSLANIKQHPNFELKIDLQSDKRAFRRQFKLHPNDAKIVKNEIDELLQHNIIEPRTSVDYNSPVFLVDKKDGSKRLVVDLRHINALIKPKLVQLPIINDLLDEISSLKCKYYSLTDLKSGFYQVNLNKKSRPLTSFTCPETGLRFQYKVAPFGLQNSPYAMLTLLMNIFSHKIKYAGVYLYNSR